MSHFATLVLVPADTPDVEQKVKELLAPYDENGQWFRDGSRWDWYQIGGRWTGALTPDYDPAKDPANREVCWLCSGTGKRTDMVVLNGCNGCDGTGTATKWPTQWKRHEGDIVPVTAVPGDFTPFALVTPDGKWRERGRMGWFAMVDDERDLGDWEATFRALLGEWPDSLAVIVDCHI